MAKPLRLEFPGAVYHVGRERAANCRIVGLTLLPMSGDKYPGSTAVVRMIERGATQ